MNNNSRYFQKTLLKQSFHFSRWSKGLEVFVLEAGFCGRGRPSLPPHSLSFSPKLDGSKGRALAPESCVCQVVNQSAAVQSNSHINDGYGNILIIYKMWNRASRQQSGWGPWKSHKALLMAYPSTFWANEKETPVPASTDGPGPTSSPAHATLALVLDVLIHPSNTVSLFPPKGLCTNCALCLKQFPSRTLND